jgi:hypothetical protein
VKHISTAVWAPPGFLQWHEVALQWPKCTQDTTQHQQQRRSSARRALTAVSSAVVRVYTQKTRALAVGTLASTTCNNLIADLLCF